MLIALAAVIVIQYVQTFYCISIDIKSKQKKTFLPRCMQCRRSLTMKILSVRLSVCLSVKRVICDKAEERSVHIFTPYERSFGLVF